MRGGFCSVRVVCQGPWRDHRTDLRQFVIAVGQIAQQRQAEPAVTRMAVGLARGAALGQQ
jgi:hypothetical protein